MGSLSFEPIRLTGQFQQAKADVPTEVRRTFFCLENISLEYEIDHNLCEEKFIQSTPCGLLTSWRKFATFWLAMVIG